STTVDPIPPPPAQADLRLNATDTPDPATAGSAVTDTFTVTNDGDAGATNISLTDTIPGGASFGSATPSQGSCSRSGSLLTCLLGGLSAGGSATVDVILTPGSAGTLDNSGDVSA